MIANLSHGDGNYWVCPEARVAGRTGPIMRKVRSGGPYPGLHFKQFSVDELFGSGAQHGFNVPATSMSEISYVLLYHLRPLVGEYFIVSPKAQLVSVFVRAKGTEYDRIFQ